MSNSRGLDTLLQAVKDNNVIVPTKDVPILNNDRFTCRIIKFGKVNDRKYKDEETGVESTSKCLRVYLHLYEFFSAENAKIDDSMKDTVITINPRLQWLSEITATQVSLEEMTGNNEEIFRHKFMLRRKDRLSAQNNKYGYIEVKDLGIDHMYCDSDDTHERVSDIDTAVVKIVPHVEENTPSGKCKVLLAGSKSLEQSLELLKPIYNSLEKTDAERAKIMEIYNEHKGVMAKELIEAAGKGGCVAKALELTTKFFAKDAEKAEELNEFAANLAIGVVADPSDELSEDDIPF